MHRSAGGEIVEGFRVAYTPGHASHHVCYLHEDSGDAFVGDMAGVRIPPHDCTVAPTPPPDIDIEAWLRLAAHVDGVEPAALCLTHFGAFTDVEEQLAPHPRRALRARPSSPDHDEAERSSRRARTSWREPRPATVETYEQAAPPDQLYRGSSATGAREARARVSRATRSSCRAPVVRAAASGTTGA